MASWAHHALRQVVAARMPMILCLLVIASSILTDGGFLRPENLINVFRQVSFEGLIAFGMTFVIVTGGIDLSVGSLVALTGVAAALVMEGTAESSASVRIALGMMTGIAVGGGVGTVSGSIIARFSIPPFIVTLSGMLVARGFAFILCDGKTVHPLPQELTWWGRGFLFEGTLGRWLPVPVVILLAGYIFFGFLFARTVFGRRVVAVGSNAEAAYLAGIPVRTTKLLVYVMIGALCGMAGVLQDAKLGVGDPNVGVMWELNVIAAVVVGGTSLFGGRGTITGTAVGALIIGVLNNSLNLLNVEHFWQNVVLGLVILAASLLDAALRRFESWPGG